MTLLFFNLLLLTIVIGIFSVYLVIRKTWWRVTGLTIMGISVTFLPLIFTSDYFELAHLFAIGIFVYIPLLLLGYSFVQFKLRMNPALEIILALVLMGVGIDAFYIEPEWLEVTRLTLESPKIREPVQFALVADLQTDRIGDYEKRVLAMVKSENPDFILFVGDYIAANGIERKKLTIELNDYLTKIGLGDTAPVFAVSGNIDGPEWTSIFDGVQGKTFTKREKIHHSGIELTALPYADSADTRIELDRADKNAYHIVFGHRPDFAMGHVDADLLVAGHTHGGQVRLPIIGPLITFSKVPRSWASGVTKLTDSRKLIVSRGIGHERGRAPRMRFLCRPELIFVELKRKDPLRQ